MCCETGNDFDAFLTPLPRLAVSSVSLSVVRRSNVLALKVRLKVLTTDKLKLKLLHLQRSDDQRIQTHSKDCREIFVHFGFYRRFVHFGFWILARLKKPEHARKGISTEGGTARTIHDSDSVATARGSMWL